MESKKYYCPNCNAIIETDLSGRSVMCENCETLFPASIFRNSETEAAAAEAVAESPVASVDVSKGNETNLPRSFIIFAIIVAIAFGIGMPFYMKNQAESARAFAAENGWISAGRSKDLIGLDPKDAEKALQDAGFENIKLEGSNAFPNLINCFSILSVYEVSINGKKHFTKNDYFPPDANVCIYYRKS